MECLSEIKKFGAPYRKTHGFFLLLFYRANSDYDFDFMFLGFFLTLFQRVDYLGKRNYKMISKEVQLKSRLKKLVSN